MKKIATMMMALMLALSMNAAERGKFIHVDATVNKNLKPQLAFCQTHKDGKDITTLLVKTVNTTAYNEFTDASRVLLRFADGKAVRLNRTSAEVVKDKKYSEKKEDFKQTDFEEYIKEQALKDGDEDIQRNLAGY
ncbi:MAG: hypothetical protein II448_03770, partial [Paludibacteraceae bacterium]|nr:hypothetical protein [Paludibacteraceae bacterium]